jgi:CRISPR/Cas system-associated exonuclease Cas4 (RecB family)
MQTLDVLRARPHISVSQIKTFIACPRRYTLQYFDLIKPDFRPIALAFGTAWHAAIGQYLQHGTTTDETSEVFREVLARAVRDDEVPVLFEDEEDLGECIDLGVRMVDVFIGRVPRPDEVLGVEVAFSLDLPDPRTGEPFTMPLIGAIDALVVDNDRACVWELKTGKKRWTADQLEYDLQMTAYRMGARVHDIDDAALQVVITTKAKTPAVQIERVTRTDRDERELANVMHGVLRAIHAGVEHPVRGWQCRSCPYAGRCT